MQVYFKIFLSKGTIMTIKIDALYKADQTKKLLIPLLQGSVSAGFPSSAENYIDKALDLNELLIRHPSATFFIRVKGDSMVNAGIKSGDILIVDRARTVTNNQIVIARINDELTVKRVIIDQNTVYLMPDNESYPPIKVTEGMDFEVWGVVTFVIHQV